GVSVDQVDPLSLSSSRSSSFAGKKRARESDEGLRTPARRTKSTSDTTLKTNRDQDAFQRGLIAIFVPKALQESLQGRMANFNDLLAHFLPTPLAPAPPLAPLLPLLRALTAHVSLLSSSIHRALVTAILNLPWATGEEKFVRSYVGFMGVLVSAHPTWSKEVVGMAVKGFTWQPPCELAPSPSITRRLYHARHHLLLSHLLSLIPTLPTLIQSLLLRQFPHKRQPEVCQTTFLRNCCELISYCPELCQRVWGEIVDRMLRIDVEITRNQDDDDESEDEILDGSNDPNLPQDSSQLLDPFDLSVTDDIPDEVGPEDDEDEDQDGADPDPDELSSEDSEASDSEGDETKATSAREKKRLAVKIMQGKLDGMLVYFLRHLCESMGQELPSTPAAALASRAFTYNPSSTSSSAVSTPTFEPSLPYLGLKTGDVSPAQSLAHFQSLLNIFSRQILPTSHTQHIPFLLFLCASFSPSHTDLFLGLLVSQALYGTTTSISASNTPISLNQRIAATVYVGSLVTRARYVNDEHARQVMTYLLAYIDGRLHHPASERFDELPLFYAVCQATMLIFCFRWRALRPASVRAREDSGEPDDVEGGMGMVGELEMDDGTGETDESTQDGRWIKDLDVLQRVITSPLNPLLGCNPTVVKTFAKVAHQTGFAYCFSIIEANAALGRNPMSSNFNTATKGKAQTPSASRVTTSLGSGMANTLAKQARQSNIDAGLDDYFPFDPYDLARSGRYVEPIYRTWSEVAMDPTEDEDEEDTEEDAEAEEEDVGDSSAVSGSVRSSSMSMSLSVSIPKGSWSDKKRRMFSRDNGLSSSLEGMSIS
ncbi:hypothetical protein TREMEDRAFT_12429, partial [Tremella mesenterica DSM 1558]|uniref:uncharacterized protein n=1 Tax=Tremella mesenterica (strain ATCC 24925 / CBS 8224 / DSM 1558 / NBRC 9311 / NRRL Y-6157 / RJB 2259-6 / UBC 559-6) TaxID=578456 RepID=UPI0003F49E6E